MGYACWIYARWKTTKRTRNKPLLHSFLLPSRKIKKTTMEEKIKQDLHQYLQTHGKVDERLPECPDIEEKWQSIAKAYLPDGIREFNAYPTVSLGWMMFIGMAMAKFWDEDWQKYAYVPNIYEQLRNQRGFDCMDEYILEDVLHMKDKGLEELNNLSSG